MARSNELPIHMIIEKVVTGISENTNSVYASVLVQSHYCCFVKSISSIKDYVILFLKISSQPDSLSILILLMNSDNKLFLTSICSLILDLN